MVIRRLNLMLITIPDQILCYLEYQIKFNVDKNSRLNLMLIKIPNLTILKGASKLDLLLIRKPY